MLAASIQVEVQTSLFSFASSQVQEMNKLAFKGRRRRRRRRRHHIRRDHHHIISSPR